LSHHSTEFAVVKRGARGLGGCAAFLWRTVSVRINKNYGAAETTGGPTKPQPQLRTGMDKRAKVWAGLLSVIFFSYFFLPRD